MATIAVFTKTDVQIKKMNRKNSNSNFHHEYKKLAKQKNQLFEKKKSNELRKEYWCLRIYAWKIYLK